MLKKIYNITPKVIYESRKTTDVITDNERYFNDIDNVNIFNVNIYCFEKIKSQISCGDEIKISEALIDRLRK